MKKKAYLGSVTLATLVLFSSCSNSTKQGEQEVKTITKDSVMLPKNATDGQVYRDNNGNNWMFNAMMGYWMMSSINNSGRENHYYYYPSTGRYQDQTGSTAVPSSVTSGVTTTKTVPVSKPKTNTNAFSSSSSSKSKVTTSKPTTPSSKSSVFGSTGRSHSIGA